MMMTFTFTPTQARATARVVATHFRKKGMKVEFEKAGWDDAGYRTSLLAKQPGCAIILIDVQEELGYPRQLREFALWLMARRHYCELYVAISHGSKAEVGVLSALKKDGVGLILVDETHSVSVDIEARNPALVITPEPSLRLGKCKAEVAAAVRKFNEVNRKDGLRDLCEIVERETANLVARAARKGWLVTTETIVAGMDWSTQINHLAGNGSYVAGRTSLIHHTFKDDLHSFRNARNLIDHKVHGKRAEAERQQQFADRMMQGPRILAKLLTLQRKL